MGRAPKQGAFRARKRFMAIRQGATRCGYGNQFNRLEAGATLRGPARRLVGTGRTQENKPIPQRAGKFYNLEAVEATAEKNGVVHYRTAPSSRSTLDWREPSTSL